jgi:hypothetical protein
LIFLAFVVPLGCYCLFLAFINKSRHPVVIAGSWDFAGILFAVSGFLLLGGPAALTGLHERWRMSWLLGETRFLVGVGEQWHFWLSLWVLYFAVVIGGSAMLLWQRRKETSIYNIDPPAFDGVLGAVLERLGLEAFRDGPRRLLIQRSGLPSKEYPAAPAFTQAKTSELQAASKSLLPASATLRERAGPDPAKGSIELEVEIFPLMRHITLHWHGEEDPLCRDVVTELTKALREIHTYGNPVGGWLMSLAVCLFSLSSLGLLAIVAFRILQAAR